MTPIKRFTFSKDERLCAKKSIDALFENSDLRLNQFPLLVILKLRSEPGVIRVLISVPKRKFRKAVTRNLIRRRVKEAYRMNKQRLYDVLPPNTTLDVAIVYTGSEVLNFDKISNALNVLIDDTGKRILKIS